MTIETPYREFSTKIIKDWIDFNGHLNVAYYHLVFDLAAKPFFHYLGITPELREAHQLSTFALESHLNFISEVKVDTTIEVESRLLDVNEKRFHFYQEMYSRESGKLAASYESLGTFMDMRTRKTTSAPEQIYQRLQQIKIAHSELHRPWQIGHVIGINTKPSA